MTDNHLERAQTGRGILLMCISVALFAVMDALIKDLTQRYDIWQVMFARNFVALLPVLAQVFSDRRGLSVLKTRQPFGHAARSLIGLSAMYGFFYSFQQLPLADVVAIGFSGPLFVTVLSVPLLAEPVGWRRWSAVLVGLAGVLLMVRPEFATVRAIILVPIVAAFAYALVIIIIRRMSRTESSVTIVFYFTLTCTLCSAASLPWVWQTPDNLRDWTELIAVGLLGGAAQLLLTRAFTLGRAAVIVPFEYSSIIWATALGWIFWAEVPGALTMVGAAIVIASGLYILHRETIRSQPGAE